METTEYTERVDDFYLIRKKSDNSIVGFSDPLRAKEFALRTQTALTTQLTAVTHVAPVTPDYAIADLTDTGGFGFASKDEGNTVLKVIANLQVRIAELETKLQAVGLLS